MFKQGDICRIVVPPHDPPHNGAPIDGEIVTLTAPLGVSVGQIAWGYEEGPLPGLYGPVHMLEESCLRKIDDGEEYDGNQTTTWDDCPFQPKELVYEDRENQS